MSMSMSMSMLLTVVQDYLASSLGLRGMRVHFAVIRGVGGGVARRGLRRCSGGGVVGER
jgi:hypothetical protein